MTARLSLALITMVVLLGACDKTDQTKKEDSNALLVIPAQQDGRIAMLVPDFTQLVERNGPAVVNIQALRVGGAPDTGDDSSLPFPDDPLFDFFRRLLPPSGNPPPSSADSVSFGSGFIISADGYIMTNAHVVQGGNPIKVMLTDKREFKAKLVGLDKRTDVAVLKVNVDSLPVVKIGNPDLLKPGEWVAAIGAPFGFENSVTAGIVSAKGRSLPDETYVPFIQTDVAINPGNSGGPLFNLKGEVVGINSQIYSRSGGFIGISFAIPINLAMSVAEQLKSKGKVSRGQLGISVQGVSLELAQSFGLKRASGALVIQVAAQSPAAKAGIQVGDIILEVDTKKVESATDLPVLIGSMQPGTKVKLTLWHKGAQKHLVVMLRELSPDAPTLPLPKSFQFPKLGLILSDLPPSQAAQFGLKGGILVEKAQGMAARSGLQAGDVIIGVNQTEVVTIKDFEQALTQAKSGVALLVRRMGETLYIPLRIKTLSHAR